MIYYILLWCLAPLLRTCTNYIDKFLLHDITYPKNHAIPVLIIFSGLIGIVSFTVALFFGGLWFFRLPLSSIILSIGAWIIYIIASFVYLQALQIDSPINIIPYFQVIPIFAIVIWSLWFQEYLNTYDIVWSVCIMLWAFLLWFQPKTYQFKRKSFLLMMLASFLFTVPDSLFKYIQYQHSFWITSVWISLGLVIVSVSFLLVKDWRKSFVLVLQNNGWKVFWINTFNEILNMTAKFIFFYLTTHLYLAHLELINSLQPAFIVIIGYFLYKFTKFGKDLRNKEEAFKQIISIALMILWVVIMNLNF